MMTATHWAQLVGCIVAFGVVVAAMTWTMREGQTHTHTHARRRGMDDDGMCDAPRVVSASAIMLVLLHVVVCSYGRSCSSFRALPVSLSLV